MTRHKCIYGERSQLRGGRVERMMNSWAAGSLVRGFTIVCPF